MQTNTWNDGINQKVNKSKKAGFFTRSIADNGTVEVSKPIVFGLLGFTLYMTWTFMVLISPAFAPANALITLGIQQYLIRIPLIVSLLATLLVCWRLSDKLSSRHGTLFTVLGSLSSSCVGVLLLVWLNSDTLELTYPFAIAILFLAFCLMGLSQGLMALLWSSFLCAIGEQRILLFCAISVGAAACLTLIMSFLISLAAALITLSLAWLSMISFASITATFARCRPDGASVGASVGANATRIPLPISCILPQLEPPKALQVKAIASDKRFNIHKKSIVSVMLYSMAIGFAVCFLASSSTGIFAIILAAIAVISASIIVIWDTTHHSLITETTLSKLHMPVVIVTIAPLFFSGSAFGYIQIFGLSVLLGFFMVVFIINLTAIAEHVRIDRLNPIRVFGFGRAGNACGFLIGCVLCYLAFFAPHNLFLSSTENSNMHDANFLIGFNQQIFFLLCLLGIFAIGASFVFEDHYPVDKRSRLAQKPKLAPKEHHLPTSDPHALTTYLLVPEDEPLAGQGIWSKRVKALSAKFGLSQKETEVLFLLAKGRNAEYIQNELVVSRHTAKAHIYHIYQKTGVHSRQDLINMLEKVEVDDE
jgi:DNA-binding CsgD family transcriptional regulator